MSTKHMVGGVDRRGQQNAVFATFMDLVKRHNEASFLTISTDMLYLRVAQTPRSPDLAIFVLTTDDRQTDDRQNRLLYPLRMRAG